MLLQVLEPLGRRREVHELGFLDEGTDPIDALALGHRPAEPGHHLVQPLGREGEGADRLPSRRLLVEDRDIHVAEEGQRQGPRDRRRRHHEEVDGLALGAEREALVDAETVLFIHHGEAEIVKRHRLLEHGMGADEDVDLARGEIGQGRPALGGPIAAGHQSQA